MYHVILSCIISYIKLLLHCIYGWLDRRIIWRCASHSLLEHARTMSLSLLLSCKTHISCRQSQGPWKQRQVPALKLDLQGHFEQIEWVWVGPPFHQDLFTNGLHQKKLLRHFLQIADIQTVSGCGHGYWSGSLAPAPLQVTIIAINTCTTTIPNLFLS